LLTVGENCESPKTPRVTVRNHRASDCMGIEHCISTHSTCSITDGQLKDDEKMTRI
jgi:hypothetical protein